MLSGLIIFFSLSPAVLTTSSAGFFDLAEYRKISYDASIGEDLFWFAPGLDIKNVSPENIDELEQRIVEKLPGETEDNYVFVTSKGGQKFACSLPEVESLKKSNGPRSSKNPKVYGELLAASFYVNKCIKMRGNHWWSYVLCRGLTVEQIHGEPDRDGYVKNILGMFDGNLTMPSYSESTEDRLLYVEESYSAGTFCDLEEYKQPRTTSVRYECDPSLSTNEAYVHSVVEVKPCQYMMFVKVGTLCNFPEFLPASQANTQNIGCQPYMNRVEIRSILVKQLEQQRRLQELEEEEREARHAFRQASERYTAMTKAYRTVDLPSLQKKINAQMDYNAANFDVLALSYERAGKDLSELSAVWDILKSVDLADYTFYVDYETIEDENRGHLWHYFHDATWPKDQFPKDIYAIAIQNGYIAEVRRLLKERFSPDEISTVYLEEFINFAKTGIFDIDLNLVITAEDILEEIARNGSVTGNSKWIRSLYRTFLSRGYHVFEKVSISFQFPRKGLPLGGNVDILLPLLFNEIEQTMKILSMTGHTENKDPIFKLLKVMPKSKDSKLTDNAAFELSIVDEEKNLLHHLQDIYLKRIAPFYHMLSIMYFQEQIPNYFHVWPPDREHLREELFTEETEFHSSLAWDAAEFSMMLSEATVMKMTHEISHQKAKVKPELDLAEFLKKRKKYMGVWELTETSYKEISFDEIFYYSAEDVAHEARKRLWKTKVEGYRMAYWLNDYKKRMEAKSLHELMHSMLHSIDRTEIVQTVGGPLKRKTKMLSERNLVDIMGKEGEAKSGAAVWEKFTDNILNSVDDGEEEVDEGWGEMKDVMDMLGKAGLNKDVEVKIKLFDEEGVEIQIDALDAAGKDLLAEVDSIKRFKNTEKAYSAKFLDEEEDER